MHRPTFRVVTRSELSAVHQAMLRLQPKQRILALGRSRLAPWLRAHGVQLSLSSPLIQDPHRLTNKLRELAISGEFFLDLSHCAEQINREHQRLIARYRWQKEAKQCLAEITRQQQDPPHGFKRKLAERCKGLDQAMRVGGAGKLQSEVNLARAVMRDAQQASFAGLN